MSHDSLARVEADSLEACSWESRPWWKHHWPRKVVKRQYFILPILAALTGQPSAWILLDLTLLRKRPIANGSSSLIKIACDITVANNVWIPWSQTQSQGTTGIIFLHDYGNTTSQSCNQGVMTVLNCDLYSLVSQQFYSSTIAWRKNSFAPDCSPRNIIRRISTLELVPVWPGSIKFGLSAINSLPKKELR